MSENKKVMRYLTIISIISIIITYIFCLAVSYNWKELKWIPYSFLIGIFSGIFASTLVALLIEFKSYRNHKQATESKIKAILLVLYIEIHKQYSHALMFLNNKEHEVPKELFDERRNTIDNLAKELFDFDYEPITTKKNEFYQAFEEYKGTKFTALKEYLGMFKYYKIGINTENIKALENGNGFKPTSEYELIRVSLKKITDNAKNRLNDIDTVLSSDPKSNSCWKSNKKEIDNNLPSIEMYDGRVDEFFES